MAREEGTWRDMSSHLKEETSNMQKSFERDCRRAAIKAALKLAALAAAIIGATLVVMGG